MLGEAGSDARFAQCSYIAARRPKSVLCSAIRHHGEVLGVIFLEHTRIAGAFNGQKLEWVRLLATEVGLAVWSARLSRYRDYVHKFAPAEVAKEIDTNPVSPNLEAKDIDVSILFGDLAGYTRMTEQLERGQLDALINRAFLQVRRRNPSLRGQRSWRSAAMNYSSYLRTRITRSTLESCRCGACHLPGGMRALKKSYQVSRCR